VPQFSIADVLDEPVTETAPHTWLTADSIEIKIAGKVARFLWNTAQDKHEAYSSIDAESVREQLKEIRAMK
jgi:hypothetical protein